ncbi:MAG: phosphoribosyl-ATP diphosphatase [Pseudomonadota bacterium]
MTDSLADVMTRLHAVIMTRKGADPETSYTAKLLAEGPARCAKKFGEEAVEAAIAGALAGEGGPKVALAAEAADTLYHLLVLLAAADIAPDDVAKELARREGVSGHDEKARRRR